MNCYHRFLFSCSVMLLLNAEKGGGSGGGTATKPKTLAEATTALDKANADLATANASITTITEERDQARADVGRLQGQFDAATAAANEANQQRDQARAELQTAQTAIQGLTTERDTARADLGKANTSISRLEKLCGIKGIDPNAAAPNIGDEATGDDKEAKITAIQQQMAAEKDPKKKMELARQARALRAGK